MQIKWNHGDLYRAVLTRYGDQYAIKIKPIIYSFPWKFYIAEYHRHEAQDIFTRELGEDEVQRIVKLVKALFGSIGDEEMDQIENLWIKNEAHIIAYAQTVHSVADNLASIIYYSVNFKNEFPGFRRHDNYYLINIKEQLKDNQKYHEIVERIDKLLDSKEFKYLKAFINTIKHTQLLDHRPSIAMNSSGSHCLVFNEFQYKNDTYPAKKANEFIDSDYYQLKRLYLEIGIAVNNLLIP